MKLVTPILPALVLGFASGCASLGQYGAMMQPGAATPGAAATPGTAGAATPTTPGTTASGSESSASAKTSSSAGPRSVNIVSSCGKTVKVFYGAKPKFGSGTYSTASSNSRSSHSFQAGDLFWIVDDRENGVSSVKVTDSTREIEILGSCTELAAR